MTTVQKAKAHPTWKRRSWRNCADVHITGEIEGAPRYLRCMRCYRLVTHGQVQTGGCVCRFRKLNGCRELTWAEILLLKIGWFPLQTWEHDAIRPVAPWLGRTVRPRLL